jgi:hypothetical protein
MSTMSTVTYGVATSARTGAPAAAPVRKRAGLFSRLFASFMAARQRQAMQELYRHGLRLPRELEDAGLKIGARNEDSLPFVR